MIIGNKSKPACRLEIRCSFARALSLHTKSEIFFHISMNNYEITNKTKQLGSNADII